MDYILKVPSHRLEKSHQTARWIGQPYFRGWIHAKDIHSTGPRMGTNYTWSWLPACVLPWNVSARKVKQ